VAAISLHFHLFFWKEKMMEIERYEIRIAGFGGQGVVTIGRILGVAFTVFSGINSVNTQSYGPESRGGACRSEVVLSHAEINYPYVRRADTLIALSAVALDTYLKDVKKGGLLIIDPDAVRVGKNAADQRVVPIPAASIAHDSGGAKYQNIVVLGALQCLIAEYIETAALKKAIKATVPPETFETNIEAFEKGRAHARAYLNSKPEFRALVGV
jgi:2-oxoglutarate ferredoxin oxidoreductase subunit gamma